MKSRFFLWTLCLILPLASCTPTNTFEENANQTESSADASVDEAAVPAKDADEQQPAETSEDATASQNDKPADKSAADGVIPEVPENGTLSDYESYVDDLSNTLNKKLQGMFAQAQKDGINPLSDEFTNSIKGMANQYFSRIEQAMNKAMLVKDISDEEFEDLIGAKIDFMMMSAQINKEDEDATVAKMEALVDQLRQLGKNEIADEIEAELFYEKALSYVRGGNVEEFTKVATEIDNNLEKAGKDLTPDLAQKAITVASLSIKMAGYKAPEGLVEKYSKAFAEASSPAVNKMVDELKIRVSRAEGEKRFIELPGKEFEFGGTFIDGSEYKPEDYAGKAVLIDFWATWCGPCCAELPNVKKAYAAYHDKGFEVIGVSCDDPTQEDVFKNFLKTNDMPWKQMFDEKAVIPNQQTQDGKPIQVSQYYSINGIPCPILIGTDGKVLSLNARGDELEEQLAKIYGEAEEPAEPAEETPAEEAASETTSGVIVSEGVNDESESEKDDAAEEADDAIPAVPENGTLEDYQEYVNKLQAMLQKKRQDLFINAQKNGVNPRSEEFANSLKEMAKEYFILIEQALDKAMLLKDVSDEDFEKMATGKFQIMQTLSQFNEEDKSAVIAKLEAFAKQVRDLGRISIAEKIESVLFQEKVRGYVEAEDVEAFTKVASEIDEKVEKAGKDITLPLAKQAAFILMISSELSDYKAPEGRQDNYLNAFYEASAPEVKKLAGALEKAIICTGGDKRFNDSLGKEFKFGGTFTDGSEYKAEDYAGKVVLIDFWATWCGPCRAELPNVKKMYNAYHDKGFEVIGVTCDDPEEEENLNKFLKDNDIPWKQMFDEKAVVPGLTTRAGELIPVSGYYGINAIPCPVLIGKDGKVISLNARAKELKEQLVKVYGEVEGLDAADEEDDPELLDVYDDEDEEEDVDDLDEEDDQAADEAIPEVPENGTLADYRAYIKKINDMLDKKAKRMERQAKKNGVDPQSEEFFNSLKEIEKEYFSRIEKALDKAILLKDIPDEEFDALYVAKLQLIQILTQISDEKTGIFIAKLQAFVDQLRKMGKDELVKDLENIIFRVKMHEYVESNNVEEFAKAALVVDERVKNAGKDITPDLAQTALLTVLGASELSEYKAPEGRNENYLKAFAEASDPEINKYVDVLKTIINQKDEE